ncbi:MAG: hypothetical protein IJF50_08470 [Peptococcaceae bacterium]|nr:hypothetical protein [Peptococcaceae bacterium]MBQ2994244.1 hypothetical protein [Peptococcaceae bacterium]
MPNSIEYADILQKELDQQMLAESTTGWMDANAGEVIYNGGSEIKVPTISMDGLADYSRAEGFPDGSVTLTYQSYTMTQDRGRSFMLDAMDVNESNFIANATNVAATFQREHVIPEVDAFRYSKIAALAKEAGRMVGGVELTADNIYSMLLRDIAAVQDVVGDVQLVITMSAITSAIVSESAQLAKRIDVMDFKRGEIMTKVKSIDGNPILVAPSARLKTEYLFKDEAAGGGFAPTEGAKNILWEICPRRVPIGLCKTDKLRIFTPEVNQKADAWKIDYRKYHDLMIKQQKLASVLVRIAEAVV